MRIPAKGEHVAFAVDLSFDMQRSRRSRWKQQGRCAGGGDAEFIWTKRLWTGNRDVCEDTVSEQVDVIGMNAEVSTVYPENQRGNHLEIMWWFGNDCGRLWTCGEWKCW